MFGLFARNSKKSRTTKRPQHRRFGLEQLENRELMAFNIFAGTPAPMGPVQSNSGSPTALVASPVTSGSAESASGATTTAAAKNTVTQVDLGVNISEGYVVSMASDDLLNLWHFWGGEKVSVPSMVRNYGSATFSGSVTVSTYLSTSRTIDSKAVKLGDVTANITLGNNQERMFSLNATIPTNLTPGTSYFLLAKVTTPVKQSTINDVSNSNRLFEFVGTPSASSNWFQSNELGNAPYLDVVNDTIDGKMMYAAPYQVNSAESMIGTSAGRTTYASVNYQGQTMIGIGMNVNGLSPTMTKALATAMRNYHKQTYGTTMTGTDQELINLLKSQAQLGSTMSMISDKDISALFTKDYAEREQIAVKLLGKSAWSQVNAPAKIGVMDMIFDTGTIDKKVVAALQAKDYVRAGFDLLNTGSVGRDQRRVRAEYQNLLWSVRSSLGADMGKFN